MKLNFFLWLNDTTATRYFWNAEIQDWVSNFDDATMFDSERRAIAEAERAESTTRAAVVIQRAYTLPH
jgi:hypothetical protein